MFLLWRRLRRQLIDEGKLGAYLGYAAGEVVLIIAAILIAFQIDGWVSDQERLQGQKALYRSMLDAIKEDQRVFDTALMTFEAQITAINRIHEESEAGEVVAGAEVDYVYLIFRLSSRSRVHGQFSNVVIDDREIASAVNRYIIQVDATFSFTQDLIWQTKLEELKRMLAPFLVRDYPGGFQWLVGAFDVAALHEEYRNNQHLQQLMYVLYMEFRTSHRNFVFMKDEARKLVELVQSRLDE